MKKLLIKEIRLAASPLSFFFIAFSLMAFVPGYPILLSAFFICFGIFHSYQSARENNDILYTVLLPVKKTDAVKAKFCFTVFIQMISFILSFIFSVIRMTALKGSAVYVHNVLMNANQTYLSWTLIIFTLFNFFFLTGFFKTAYKFTRPFLTFCITAFLAVCAAESLHHFPRLRFLNDTAAMQNGKMWLILAAAMLIYIAGTFYACKISIARFETVDM